MTSGELTAAARAIIDANVYLTLGTVGDDSRPWVSPEYDAALRYREFCLTSDPGSAHSQNLGRPDVSLVIFDWQQPPYTGEAVYMTGVAQELTDRHDIEYGLAVYPGQLSVRNRR